MLLREDQLVNKPLNGGELLSRGVLVSDLSLDDALLFACWGEQLPKQPQQSQKP